MADRIVAGIVFVMGGKILLVLDRKAHGDCRRRWSIPKGRYREGADSDLFAAGMRELKEETGIDLARLDGAGLSEANCLAKGRLSYVRKGRVVTLHYFVVEYHKVVLDSFSTGGEAMSGVGFFVPSLARELIREEQMPLLDVLDRSAHSGETACSPAKL